MRLCLESEQRQHLARLEAAGIYAGWSCQSLNSHPVHGLYDAHSMSPLLPKAPLHPAQALSSAHVPDVKQKALKEDLISNLKSLA